MKYAKVLRQALNALFYLCSLIGFMQFLSLIMFPHLRLVVLILIAVGIFLWCIIYAVETPKPVLLLCGRTSRGEILIYSNKVRKGAYLLGSR